MNKQIIDKVIILLFYISIIIFFYYSALSQSGLQGEHQAPMFALLFPFGISLLQVLRVLFIGGNGTNPIAKSWISIFIYYLFAFLVSSPQGASGYSYNTVWFVVCPPVAWFYFSNVISNNRNVQRFLQKWSFWLFLLLSIMSLYFIPRSVRDNGLFSSLNTGYYILFAYPMVLFDSGRIKKIIATLLLVLVIFLSLKRGGIVAIGLGYALYFIFSSKTHFVRNVVVAGLSIILLLGYVIPKINEYTNGTLMARYEFTQDQGDAEGRTSMYPLVWKTVAESSTSQMIVGHGHNGVVNDNVLQGLSAHNDYLEFLYDYGIVGLILYIIYQVKLFKITKLSHRLKKDFLPAIFTLTSVIVLSLVSILYSYYYSLLIIPFWCVLYERLKDTNQSQYENRNTHI